MLLSAVSFGLALLSNEQVLQKKEAKAWDTAKSSVVMLLNGGQPSGQAALIDKSGLFLANQSAISTPTILARLSDGRIVTLTWKATDIPTQTVLLQAENWPADQGAAIVVHEVGVSLDKTPVVVVLPSGPVLGQLTDANRVGVLSTGSKRMFPLGEVRFEATAQSVAGALVFDEAGHLAGILNATLDSQQHVGVARIAAPQSQGLKNSIGAWGAKMKQAGPADATVGYTVAPEVLRRVIAGFLSPSHKVLHPAIGIFCKEGASGALIVTVKPESPAAKAGIQPGDTIIRMDEKPIRDQFDFARVIESKDPGETLTIVVMRDLIARTFKVTVGAMQKTE